MVGKRADQVRPFCSQAFKTGVPFERGILFESFNGETTNDNPRALFDAIRGLDDGTPLYWSVRDRTVEVPPGGIPVVEGTAAWHRALATTRVSVNNNNFPYLFRKNSPEQFYLQTWHGTPIKRLLWTSRDSESAANLSSAHAKRSASVGPAVGAVAEGREPSTCRVRGTKVIFLLQSTFEILDYSVAFTDRSRSESDSI